MNFTFNGEKRIIYINSGVEIIDSSQMYTDYKDWIFDNPQWILAMRTIGGESIGAGQIISPYIQLINGWRIKPFEGDHVLTVLGNIITEAEDSPFLETDGAFNVSIRSQVTSNSITQATIGAEFAKDVWDYDLATHEDSTTTAGSVVKNKLLRFVDWFTLKDR